MASRAIVYLAVYIAACLVPVAHGKFGNQGHMRWRRTTQPLRSFWQTNAMVAKITRHPTAPAKGHLCLFRQMRRMLSKRILHE